MSTLRDHARHFERLYARNDDPWDYAASSAEAFKRRAVGQALGAGRRGVGLELGCGPGIATLALAERFAVLVALDGSARAVALALDRTRDLRTVRVLDRRLPDGFPRGAFDAVVASEVLYYLPRPALTRTLQKVRDALRPGGCFVTVNSLAAFSDRECAEEELSRRLRAAFGAPVRRVVGAGWRLDRFVPRRGGRVS